MEDVKVSSTNGDGFLSVRSGRSGSGATTGSGHAENDAEEPDLAALATERVGALTHPAHLAVGSHDAELVVERASEGRSRFGSIPRISPSRATTRSVAQPRPAREPTTSRRARRGPTPSRASARSPRAQPRPVAVDDVEADIAVCEQRAEDHVAALARLLGLAPGRHVLDVRHQVERLSVVAASRCGADTHPDRRAAGTDAAALGRLRLVGRSEVLGRRAHAGEQVVVGDRLRRRRDDRGRGRGGDGDADSGGGVWRVER